MTPKVLVLRINFRVQIHPQKQLNIIPLPYYPWYTFHAGFIYYYILPTFLLFVLRQWLLSYLNTVCPYLEYGYLSHPLLLLPLAKKHSPKTRRKANKPLKKTPCKKTTLPTVAVITIPKKPCNLRSLLLSSPSLDPNCRDDRGDTALHLAAGNGERGACELLLKHPRIDRTLQDEDGRTAPRHFCNGGNHKGWWWSSSGEEEDKLLDISCRSFFG